MSQRIRRYHLKTKEAKELLEMAFKKLKLDETQILSRKFKLEAVEIEHGKILLLDEKPVLVKLEKNIFPTLVFKEFLDVAPKVIVDMGAIPYVCKGANVMAPGIRRFEGEFEKGDYVIVVDENHRKPLAVGESIYEAKEARNVKQGLVVNNVHFVGDKIWNYVKTIAPQHAR